MKFGTTKDEPKSTEPIYLNDPSRLSILPDGEYSEIHRPLAMEYSLPGGRGVEAHGVDSDVKVYEFLPDENEDEQPNQTVQDTGYLIPPVPIPVHVVYLPERSVRRFTRIINPFGLNELYTLAFTQGIDDTTTRQVLPYEDNRISATFFVAAHLNGGATQASYAYCVSDVPYFEGVDHYIQVPVSGLVIYGKNPLYMALLPGAVYDSLKQNNNRLSIVCEYEELINQSTQ